MSIEVRDHVSISVKLNSFDVAAPNGLAVLPYNLETATCKRDLRQHVESDTVRTLFSANNIPYVEIFDEHDQPLYLQQYGLEWFGPTLFISAGVMLQNPNMLSVSLSLIANYLYDLFKGSKGGSASLNVIFQNANGACKEIRYSGPPEGLSAVADIVKELGDQ